MYLSRSNRVHGRRCRAKTCLAWQRYDVETRGIYSVRLSKIAAVCPDMTPTQLRIAALVTGLLPSHQIASILCITESAVERVRSRIRRRLMLSDHASLTASLLSILEKNESVAQMWG
jgi:DNA-binding CsgD family transcriptional regulator